MACLRTRSESLVATRQVWKDAQCPRRSNWISKMVHLTARLHHITICNSWARPHQRGEGCWSSLESWCEEGECLKSDPGWKLYYGLRLIYKQKCLTRAQTQSGQWNLKLLTLEPWFIANFTVEKLKWVAFYFYGNQRVRFNSMFIQWNFAVLHSSSKVFTTYCYFLLLLAFSQW